MADGVVDRLVIATEFDESGLDRGTKAQLAHLERFVAQVGQLSRNLPPITVDATQITTALAQAGGDLEAFARILAQLSPTEFVAALDAMVQELGEAGGQFKATSVEGRALQSAIDLLRTAQSQALGATQAATTALTQEAGAARLTANAATDLVTALERTGVATRQLASQSTQPIALNVQPAINAADTLISRMGLAQRSVNSVRQVLATPLPPIRPDPNLPILTSGYIAQTAAVQRLAAENLVAVRSVDAMAAAMARGSTGALAWGQGAAQINAQNRALATGGAAAGKGMERVRAGLTGLALSASGTSPAIGQVVSGLLLLGGGSTVVLGVAAGIAAIAAAFNLIEGPTKRARKEVEDLIETLERARIGRLPGFEQVGLQLDEVRAKMVATGLRVEELRTIITRDQNLAGGAFRQGQLDKELALLKQLKVEATDLQRVQQGLQVARGNELIRSLAIQQATYGKTAIEAQRLAVAMDDSLTPAQRRAATAILNNLAALDRQKQSAAAAADEIKRSADEVLRAFRSTQSLAGLGDVLSLTADTSDITRQIDEAERQLASLRSQGTRITISGDAEALLREITIVEGRLTKLRAQRGGIAVTGDASALTAEIAKAERELVALRAQAVNLRIDGDAAPVLRSIATVEARLADLRTERAQITLTGDASGLTQQITEAEAQLGRLRAQGVALALTADPTQLIRQIDEAEARVKQLRGQAELITLAGDTDVSPLTQEIARVDAQLAQLRATSGTTTDAFRAMQQQRTGLVEKQREAEQLVASFQRIGQEPLELKFEARLDLGNPDQALAELLKELQQRADERVFGLTLKALRVPVEVDTSLLGDADRAIEALNTDLARQNPIWREANAQAAKMARHLDDNRTNAERFADELDGVLRGIGDIAGAASNIGLIGDEAARAIGDVLSLGDAISSVVKEASTANILGLVGAGINLIGGLFGGGESEHDRIVRENTEAIKRNTAARSDTFAGLGGAEDLARTIGQLLGDSQFRGAAVQATLPGGIGIRGQEEVERQLAAFGLTLADLDRVAQMHGLDILDDKGRLVVGALDQLQKAIEADIQASLRFRDTLDDLTLAGDLRARISGEGLDPTAAFQRELEAAGKLGGSAVTDFFKGIDLGDPDELRKASLGLLDAFENGQLDASKLGKLSREDILRILGDSASLIEALGESALGAANELSIIPKGFRQAALAFEAQIPGLGPNAVAPVLKAVDIPLVELAVDATDALERLIPEPILISGAELLDRLVTIGAIPATTGLPAGLPSDGAALPQIAVSLGSATSVLAQIAATLGTLGAQPAAQAQTNQELSAAVARLMELLAKAKIGQNFGDINIQWPSSSPESHQQAVDFRRALEDISMADYGRTDRWGQT